MSTAADSEIWEALIGIRVLLKRNFTRPLRNDHPAQRFLSLLNKNHLGSLLTIYIRLSPSPAQMNLIPQGRQIWMQAPQVTRPAPVSAFRKNSRILKAEVPAPARHGWRNTRHRAGSTSPNCQSELCPSGHRRHGHSDKLGLLRVFAYTMRRTKHQPILILRHGSEFQRWSQRIWAMGLPKLTQRHLLYPQLIKTDKNKVCRHGY